MYSFTVIIIGHWLCIGENSVGMGGINGDFIAVFTAKRENYVECFININALGSVTFEPIFAIFGTRRLKM